MARHVPNWRTLPTDNGTAPCIRLPLTTTPWRLALSSMTYLPFSRTMTA